MFQDVEPPTSKSISRKVTTFLGRKRSVHFSEGTLRHGKFGKEGVHPKVLFIIVNLMSEASMLLNLRTDLRKKP